jgi:hypothetical protein
MLVSKLEIAVVKADTPLYAPEVTSAAGSASPAIAHNQPDYNLGCLCFSSRSSRKVSGAMRSSE